MLEDLSGVGKNNNQERQRTTLQRSNRVFILQYSPERSKSKKQKKWDILEPKKEKLSSYLSRKNVLSENDPLEDFTHRRNIDRLNSLISRNSRNTEQPESGCEKLVKVVDKILKTINMKAVALEALKKYSMLCSSANYQLFIQSRHNYLLKDAKKNETPLSPLARINEYQENHLSNQSSQLSPRKSPLQNEITFRKKAEEVSSPKFSDSLYNILQSPKKYFETFNYSSRDYIPTTETLNSYTDLPLSPLLPSITTQTPKRLILRKQLFTCGNLNQSPLLNPSKQKHEVQFLHLCHLEIDICSSQDADEGGSFQQFEKIINSISINKPRAEERLSQPVTNAFNNSRNRFNYAIPTALSPKHQSNLTPQQNKININYVSENLNSQSFKKPKRNNQVLNAKQIAERMLFGVKNPDPVAVEKKTERIGGDAADAKIIKKRVSSLPKITFTYSSRQKDPRFQCLSPSTKLIPAPADKRCAAEPLKAIIKIDQQRKPAKQQLHSTFGSTQMAANSSRSSRLKSPQQLQSPTKVLRIIKPTSYHPFAGVPLQNTFSPTPKIDNEYYGGYIMAQKQPLQQQQIRQRIATQMPSHSGDVQYVGIQQQPRGCCWARQVRSRSLNDRVLVGVQR